MADVRWVLLAYRLPREPSTPRIALWRKLRQLGALQVLDGLAALPLDDQNREQFEWLADAALEAGGEASVWVAQPGAAAQERALVADAQAARAAEYEAVITAASSAQAEDDAGRRRTVQRLRRELRRIRARDYVAAPQRAAAEAAVDDLAAIREVLP